MEGGWRHKPVQFTKSFIPWRGWEQGTPVFYGREGLSFYSQSFRPASETEERKRTTEQQTCYICDLAGRLWHSPGMGCWCLSWDFYLFSDLYPAPSLSPGLGTGPAGMGGFSWQREVEVPSHVGHGAWRWQPRPFPELWGCSCSSAAGSI